MLLPPRFLSAAKHQFKRPGLRVFIARRIVVPTVRAGRVPGAITLLCLSCLLCRPAQSRQGAVLTVTQRGINEMAASVEQARRTFLEDAHLRRPGEDLSAYLRRIALPVSGETKQQYFARAAAYVDALEQSANVTRAGRRMPVLHAADAFNQEQWTRAVRALQILPARVLKTQAAWRRVQAGYNLASSHTPQDAQAQFAAQLQQTVQVVIAADDALHNAKP